MGMTPLEPAPRKQSAFREQIRDDIYSVFFNLDEFGEMHVIDGKHMPCVIETLNADEKGALDSDPGRITGIYSRQIKVFAARRDMGRLPARGRKMTVDGGTFLVLDSDDKDGLYTVTMEAVKA